MKASILLDMIGDTDDGIIEEAKKREKPVAARLARWIAVAACLCLIVAAIVGLLKLINKTPSDHWSIVYLNMELVQKQS